MAMHTALEVADFGPHVGLVHGSVIQFPRCDAAQAQKLASNCVDTATLGIHRLIAGVIVGVMWVCSIGTALTIGFQENLNIGQMVLLACVLTLVYDKLASLLFSPPLWFLVFGRKPMKWRWPSLNEMEEAFGMPEPLRTDNMHNAGYLGGNHLRLGLTRFAFRDALLELLPGYCRGQTCDWRWQWLKQEHPQRPLMSYDVIAAIQLRLAHRGLGQYSLAQIMSVAKHPGATAATTFLSHRQDEEIWETCAAMKQYARSCWTEPVFWVDVVCLKQSWNAEVYENRMGREFVGSNKFPGDFSLKRMKRCIQDIGNTVMVTSHHGNTPQAMERMFCVFEVYATTCSQQDTGKRVQFHIAASAARARMCVVKNYQIRVDVEAADSRDVVAKTKILSDLRSYPGPEVVNQACEAAIAQGDADYIRNCWHAVTFAFLLGIVAVVFVTYTLSEESQDFFDPQVLDIFFFCSYSSVMLLCGLGDAATLDATRRIHRAASAANGIFYALAIFFCFRLSIYDISSVYVFNRRFVGVISICGFSATLLACAKLIRRIYIPLWLERAFTFTSPLCGLAVANLCVWFGT